MPLAYTAYGLERKKKSKKYKKERGTWVAQLVERLPSAWVVLSHELSPSLK